MLAKSPPDYQCGEKLAKYILTCKMFHVEQMCCCGRVQSPWTQFVPHETIQTLGSSIHRAGLCSTWNKLDESVTSYRNRIPELMAVRSQKMLHVERGPMYEIK